MISRTLTPLAFGLALLVAWQAIVMVGDIPEYLLPSPTAIATTVDRALAVQFAVTFVEALAGFLIASALAFAPPCSCGFTRSRMGFFPSPLR
jgi:NitT/TauT family transport system permease protein